MPTRNHILLLLMLVVALACPGVSAAAGADVPPAAPAEPAVDDVPDTVPTAPVVIDGVVLFNVRGIATRSAATRADNIANRIVAMARDDRIAADAIKLDELPFGSRIMAGNQALMTVLDADARVEGIERAVLAQDYLQQIARAVSRYRSDREPMALARGAGYASVAVALLILVLYALLRLRRRVDTMLERRYRARFEHLQIAGFKLLHAHHLWGGLRSIVAAAFALFALTCVYLTLDFALAQFPGTRGIAVSLLDLVVGSIAQMGRGLVSSIPGLVFLLILVLVTRYVLQTLRLLFSAVEQGSVTLKGFDRDWAMPTYRILRLLVVAFAVVVAFPYIPGSHSDAFKGVSIFLGLVFSLGSTSIVANTIAGYTMTYRRAFRVGDWIQVGDVFGEVTEVRIQVTHLRSRKNEEIVLPNSKILNSEVVNYSTLSTTKGLVLHTTVGIGYDTPWRQVEAMLLTAAGRTPGLLLQPQPFVHALSLGDFAVTYELNVYCDRPGDRQAIYGDLHCNILDVFNEYGVAIMTPAYEGDPEHPKLVPKDQWYAAPARRPDSVGG